LRRSLYAPVIRDEFGPVDVMALSTGGLIAQHLALRHPALVRRLVLVVTGARIANAGRQICQTWLTLCQRQDWRRLRGALAASAVDGPVATWLARSLASFGGEPDRRDVADFSATVLAVLQHDTTGALHRVTVPTLILGGQDDPFFPEPMLRATAAEIPGALAEVHPGGHGIPKQHSRWLQNQVAAFLADTPDGQ
jgi:pimeloyl-ACP methyl ester carboxylesterase